jgi:L-ascorbate metabolism protein UlaG (beta-lactamase superfamily)
MKITWLGHGTFQFELPSGEVIVMDPWIDGNPARPAGAEIRRADLICISHGHFDHIHDAVPLAKKFNCPVVAIFETCKWLESKGVKDTRPMNKGGSQTIGRVTVTMTHAVHSCGILDGDQIIYGGEACGYVLRFDDNRSLYFAGDTNVFSDMQLIEQLYHPDLAFLPIGDLFTMGPKEAALACCMLKPKGVVPMHFGTFPPLTGRPDKLAELIRDQKGTEVWPLEPGRTVEWQTAPRGKRA